MYEVGEIPAYVLKEELEAWGDVLVLSASEAIRFGGAYTIPVIGIYTLELSRFPRRRAPLAVTVGRVTPVDVRIALEERMILDDLYHRLKTRLGWEPSTTRAATYTFTPSYEGILDEFRRSKRLNHPRRDPTAPILAWLLERFGNPAPHTETAIELADNAIMAATATSQAYAAWAHVPPGNDEYSAVMWPDGEPEEASMFFDQIKNGELKKGNGSAHQMYELLSSAA